MPSTRTSLRAATGLAALALALPAAAQEDALPPVESSSVEPMSQAEIDTLPEEYRSLPLNQEITTTTVGQDGVETITRTRRIGRNAPAATQYYPANYPANVYPAVGYAPAVLNREQWIAECERRTVGQSDDDKGIIIGGLLGAIGGGIVGNVVAASGEALAGTLIGAGVGGLAGVLIGSLFDGEDDEDRYDCAAALNNYLDQYGQGTTRVAARAIPSRAPVGQPVYYQTYPTYGYEQPVGGYPQQQTMTMIPVTTYQPQRVIVRETIREETAPGALRTIPRQDQTPELTPGPSPKMIGN
ncbi:MAG: hypothetical protein QNI87_07995 [Erythrobacter sp.]|uniref:hypothetical protein n=1 Tax=Erythrobacter sp. TaxID=1042 RepID=UPI0026366A64|nr:hypothetical protein [Erythrobacter sp.]MDJ0978464.1 hypothetical protein [Erythrobacter sp.]